MLELKNDPVEPFYLPSPKAYFNQVIASDVVAGNGAITDRPQGTAYQNWRLNFHKQKDHSCSLKPVTVLSTKGNLTRNTRWGPGSLWPQLWSESESSSPSWRTWINRANFSFSIKKINPSSRACFMVCQLCSPLEPKLSCQVLALEAAPSVKICGAFWMGNRQLRLVVPLPRTPKPCCPRVGSE